MSGTITADLCVIGAGSGGLSVAAGAVQMGASVVLIEQGRMGGDCLNTGCVPSKSLLAASHAMSRIKAGAVLGVAATATVHFEEVRRHVARVIAAIAPHDSVERFERLGVTVISGRAAFTGRKSVAVAGRAVHARRFVLAVGSRPALPAIPGLATLPVLTNENVFEQTTLPAHLVVVGGGAIGCELAQAFRGLGAEVTVIESATLLGREDPEFTAVVRKHLQADGITILERASIQKVESDAGGVAAVARLSSGDSLRVTGSHLLVATGRRPNVNGLGLDVAGVEVTSRGMVVDRRLRTTNPNIFAVGDCAGGPQFTHVAGYHAGIVIRQALFRLPAAVDYSALPRAVYTDPEMAQVGMTEAEARDQQGDSVRVLTSSFAENDRARAEGGSEGMIKAVIGRRGKILGAGIVGRHAGELIQPWVLAMANGLKIGAMASMVAPYPTLGEINKRAAGSYFTPMLYGERTRKLVRFLASFG